MLGLLGAGSFAAGVLAVFITQNGTGAGVLTAFGGVVLVVAMLGNRIESLEFGAAKLRLRAAAAERFALADELDRSGDPVAAERVRAQAEALLAAAKPIAAEYRALRDSMPSSPERTRAMEQVVARARELARERTFDPAEVSRWLRAGSEEERITALGMMQARPELRDFDAALAAIEHARSAFEQYHALVLVVDMVDGLDAARRSRLGEVLRTVRATRLPRGGDRWQVSEQILGRLDAG